MTGRKRLVAYEADQLASEEVDTSAVEEQVEESSADDVAADDAPIEAPADAYTEDAPAFEDSWEDEMPSSGKGWIVPFLGVVAMLGWTGFFAWVHRVEMLAGATTAQWIDWIGSWSLPILVIIGFWLLALRNSVREAHRFGQTARMLSNESSLLERRLSVVNRELSLARDFVASQSRDLEALGRIATERLTANADRLQELIRDNGQQVSNIGEVSDTALSNMDRLRDQLPVISNAARDVTNQIGNAGNTAQGQLNELVSGFAKLTEFGDSSAEKVDGLRAKVAEVLDSLVARSSEIEQQAEHRFALLRNQNEEFRLELEARETDALAAIRRRARELNDELTTVAEENRTREESVAAGLRSRLEDLRGEGARLLENLRDGQEQTAASWANSISALQERMEKAITDINRIDEAAIANARRRMEALSEAGQKLDQSVIESADAFEEEFGRRREAAEEAEKQALATLQERLASFDISISERKEEHLAHMATMAERGDALSSRLAEFDREMTRLAEQGREESLKLGDATDLLADRLSQSRAILEESGTFVNRLTDDSVRLLEIIRSSSDHSEGALSNAIMAAERRLQEFESRAAGLTATIAEAEAKGGVLAEHVNNSREASVASLETVEKLEARLSSLASQSQDVAEKARGELQSAIVELESASQQAMENFRSGQLDAIHEIAGRIGAESSETIGSALRESALATIAELEETTALANERGRDTARQMRDQLSRVNELARNLEQRVAQAREQAEEKVDHDFSRRMALITESLNSASIDIAKAFDSEVADTAWASYLRGDRGIFTRRAVRLLDGHEARLVTGVYEEDAEVREAINRYIHDFEAMLRSVLSTRDGNAIAVTLLSSDIGKLYVALAQAIERLRD
ncbi:ATPase [Alteraurantiacibacter aquimixticola]|uniref:ATPase n=1 Tax=Alteraurantiacibacter aquimixticola TaxID=2489173 RepID=A0A4T3EZ31_9SPHN|nr:ATPase [Alteraurantiacibacter aquimixticola]TIX50002.1 ATPase [Alteraurantiacibacter aquimixticola]